MQISDRLDVVGPAFFSNLDTFQGYKVGTFTSKASTGNQSVAGIGFKPRLVVLAYGNGDASYLQASMGAFTSANQVLGFAIGEVAGTPGDPGGIPTQSGLAIAQVSSSSAILASASYVSMDADGFTLNWSVAHADLYMYIAFQ